jgi:LysR family transcriptional regulator, mexEF-oprN operon transcriptional activator
LPRLLARLRTTAPNIQLIVLPVQFRTVEDALLTNQVDLALSVADDLPRSILRQPLSSPVHESGKLIAMLYDPRFTKLSKVPTEREYFAQEHVVVSYAGDTRGVVEDSLGKARKVRVSVPAFGHVADLVDGSPLVATVPALLAHHIIATRPHLRSAPIPFHLDPVSLDLLWLRLSDADEVSRFLRDQIVSTVAELSGGSTKTKQNRARRRRSM